MLLCYVYYYYYARWHLLRKEGRCNITWSSSLIIVIIFYSSSPPPSPLSTFYYGFNTQKKSFRWCWWYWYAACLTMKVYLVWFAKRLILILFCLPLDFFHLLVEEYLVAPTHFIFVHSAHIVLQWVCNKKKEQVNVWRLVKQVVRFVLVCSECLGKNLQNNNISFVITRQTSRLKWWRSHMNYYRHKRTRTEETMWWFNLEYFLVSMLNWF